MEHRIVTLAARGGEPRRSDRGGADSPGASRGLSVGRWLPGGVGDMACRTIEAAPRLLIVAVAALGQAAAATAQAPAPDCDSAPAPAGGTARHPVGLWPPQHSVALASQGARSEFGAAVAIGGDDGDIVWVGAPEEVVDGARRGGVHGFRRVGGSPAWHPVGRGPWTPASLSPGSRFGATLVTAGDWLLVGAPGADAAGLPRAGRVEVHRASDLLRPFLGHGATGGGLPPAPVVRLAGRDVDGGFGSSIAVRVGPTGAVLEIAVGAPTARAGGANGPVPLAGSVTVFRPAGGGVSSRGTVVAPSPALAMGFGASLAYCGDLLVVGAPGDGQVAPGAGRIFAFHSDLTPAWSVGPPGGVPQASAGARFGESLAAIGDASLAIGVRGRGAVQIMDVDAGGARYADLLRAFPGGGVRLASECGAVVVSAAGSAQGSIEVFGLGPFDRAQRVVLDVPGSSSDLGSGLAAHEAPDGTLTIVAGDPLGSDACPVRTPGCAAGAAHVWRLPPASRGD